MMIYTFLLILVFMYIGAKTEIKKTGLSGDGAAAGYGRETEETAGENGGEKAGKSGGEMTRTAGETGEEITETAEETVGPGARAQEVRGREAESRVAESWNAGNPPEAGPVLQKDDMWALILTNARYPIPEDYSVELKELPGTEQSVDARIYDAVVQMISDMKEEGLHPIVCSAYRTLDRQEILFNRKVKNYVKRGYSMEDAYKEAQHVLSIPGSGEHCLGLAVDIFSQSYQKLEVGFENTKEGKWLREHCAEYGFILRYDKGKEESTGINYEPWHFRYVGKEAAEYIMEKGISLEEFYIEESLYG